MSHALCTVFLDHVFLDPGGLDTRPLHTAFDELQLHVVSQLQEVAARLHGVRIAVSSKAPIDVQYIAARPELELILVSAIGTDNIDLATAHEYGIIVVNCHGYDTPPVVQYTLVLLPALTARLPDYQQAVRSDHWQQSSQFCLLGFPIVELEGKTLGPLSHDELSGAVARLAEAFGIRVLLGQLSGWPARADRLLLGELLPRVDALILHCPLTEDIHGIFGAAELVPMKPGASLVDTAHDGLIDEQALANALRGGHLGGTAANVLSVEPPRNGNPLLAPDIPRLIVTPHNAWDSCEARQRIVGQLAENAGAWKVGRTLQVTNAD